MTLVEYGDFECPHCGHAYPIVKTVQRSLGDDLGFAYRHFPLVKVHPHAEHAAEIAEAAGEHGKFWPMHDLGRRFSSMACATTGRGSPRRCSRLWSSRRSNP